MSAAPKKDLLDDEIVAILLAAGAGKRFGGNKLLRASLNEIPLALIAAQTYQQVLPLFVVIRAGDDELKSLYEQAGFKTIVAKHAAKGMGNSLAAGLEHVRALNKKACLVGLADMPLIKEETLRVLVLKLKEGAEIVRPIYKGRVGQPVGFGQCHFESLIGLKEDKGARDYLSQHKRLIEYVEVSDVGTVTDVDTPEDLAKILASV